MAAMQKLSIVIPVFNEEKVVAELYRRLEILAGEIRSSYEVEVIFVDDGSSDNTFGLLIEMHAKDPRVKAIKFSRNFGHQMAVSAGLSRASGDAIIIMDADLQDPPEVVSEMLRKWREGFKVVYAIRRERRGEGWLKKKTAQWFYALIGRISKTNIPPNVGDFRLLDREVVDVLNSLKEQHRFLRGLVSWAGFKQTGVYFDRPERFAGTTHYPFKKMFRFAVDGITSFSVTPLRIAMYLGFFAAIISILVGAYSLVQHFIYPESTVRGWTSLMMAILFFGGAQLITIGILGEYIGRIYEESKKRPLYIIESLLGISEDQQRP